MDFPLTRRVLASVGLGLTLLLHGWATENGTSAFPNGAEDFLAADMPPPGNYGWLTYNRYEAERILDGSGQMPVTEFGFTATAIVPRLDWVKPSSIFGTDRWGTLFIVPLLDLDLALSPAPGVRIKSHRRGLGDLAIGNGLHWTLRDFGMINAFDVVVPTGAYDATAAVNPGQNHWVVRLSHLGTWHPQPAWDLSYRAHWDYNFRNPATGYRSGQTLYLNWAAGWKPQPRLTLGLAGYFLRQISDDDRAGQRIGADGNRTRVSGAGPCVKYFLANHVMLTAKYFREFDARQHPQGEQVWFSCVVPLSPPR